MYVINLRNYFSHFIASEINFTAIVLMVTEIVRLHRFLCSFTFLTVNGTVEQFILTFHVSASSP
jgi:hypothetical protein